MKNYSYCHKYVHKIYKLYTHKTDNIILCIFKSEITILEIHKESPLQHEFPNSSLLAYSIPTYSG